MAARASSRHPCLPAHIAAVDRRAAGVVVLGMKRDPWPSKEHRTLAQVARTIELGRRRYLSKPERVELLALVNKAARFNPPPGPQAAA